MVADPNAHIRQSLEYYLGLREAPYYAVMVKGPWGSGKTFLVKRLLKQLKTGSKKHVYVSLYGVGSKEEFDRAVLVALYPFLTNKAVKASFAAIGGLLSSQRLSFKLSVEDFLEKFNADVFVFDDLERSGVKAEALLGYINSFVEHGECKVVILANDQQIAEGEGGEAYRKQKEKVVGLALEVKPDAAAALPVFLQGVRDKKAREFLASQQPLVETLVAEGAFGNLRVARQALEDFERFSRLSRRNSRRTQRL